jgi:voltage-gated potassium channel
MVTVLSGIAIRLADHRDFDKIGSGIWWAVQTVTTVGYGDLVPHNTAGRVIAALVMLTGIAFVTVITAAITATLVEEMRRRREGVDPEAGRLESLLGARLEVIGSRLEAIETTLTERGKPPDR